LKDVAALGQSFNGSVSGAMWELDRPLLKIMAQGIVQSSIVTGVKVISDNREVMATAGNKPSPVSAKSTDFMAPFQFQSTALIKQTSQGKREIGQMIIHRGRAKPGQRLRFVAGKRHNTARRG